MCVAIAKGERKEANDSSLNFGNDIRVIGVGYQLAKGIKKGYITNLEELEDSILNAIVTTEKEAQKSIKSVFVALPAWAIESQTIETSIEIGQLPVDDIHVNSLIDFDTTKYIEPDMEVIHIFPISYSIDEAYGIQDPLGMVGEKLSAIFHVMTAKSAIIKNIKNTLNRNSIEVSGFICSSYASTLSVALDEEISSGVTVIDIGGSTTSISCIHDGTLLYMGTIALGGNNITNDIAMVLRTNKSSAERLKILYGVSSAGETNGYNEEQILVSRIDEYGEEHIQNISKNMLDSIISARLEEILELCQKHIYECGADKILYQRIVITGGGSRLSGLNEFIKAKRYFGGLNVRLGKPIGTIGSHDFVKTASFATAAGTVLYCLGNAPGRASLKVNNDKSFWQRLITWFKRGI